eukprot:TRINITY_DN11827_c0_g1_i2.p1 TRINITY_DN11827_c0_g1~~TRINITY_DN11827_c0_g1_i2.p1  ORF type:complete len:341 (+),score=54.45 TRINITY_DN11827_c0_g1_i2:63-1025(+)
MLKRTQKALYKVYGGKVFMDVDVWSTLEPHAERFKFENVRVDPNVTGLVLPLVVGNCFTSSDWMAKEVRQHEPLENLSKDELEALSKRLGWHSKGKPKGEMINGLRLRGKCGALTKSSTNGNLLKEVFRSWVRMYHQKEFERSYLTKRIEVLELGPFEVLLEGLERPMVANVQFTKDMPLTPDGKPDIRIGLDIARRSRYLHPELANTGLIGSLANTDLLNLAAISPYGAPPSPTASKPIPGSNRLYPDDRIRTHWAVTDGQVRSNPPTPLSVKPDPIPARQWAEKLADLPRGETSSRAEPTSPDADAKKSTKKWGGWGA